MIKVFNNSISDFSNLLQSVSFNNINDLYFIVFIISEPVFCEYLNKLHNKQLVKSIINFFIFCDLLVDKLLI